MNRRVVGAIFIAVGAILYGARHVGAMAVVATKSGDQAEQYRFALQSGGTELFALSVAAVIVGLVYLAWGELEGRPTRS